jgi:hypothetical protein
MSSNVRELAMFNLVIEKRRACDLTRLRVQDIFVVARPEEASP